MGVKVIKEERARGEQQHPTETSTILNMIMLPLPLDAYLSPLGSRTNQEPRVWYLLVIKTVYVILCSN